MQSMQEGRFFRQAWIAGVKKYFPGTPKPGYIAPWEDMAAWEQQAALAVYEQVQQFVLATAGGTTHLNPEQKGRFVALCWIGQIYKRFHQRWKEEESMKLIRHGSQIVALVEQGWEKAYLLSRRRASQK